MRRSLMPRRQHEEILAAQQRRHQEELGKLQAELADITKDRDRLRVERDQFKKDRDTHRDAAKAARIQLAKYEKPTTVVPVGDPAAKVIDDLKRQLRNAHKRLDDATSAGDIGVPASEDWRKRSERQL